MDWRNEYEEETGFAAHEFGGVPKRGYVEWIEEELDQRLKAGQHETIVIGRTLMDDMDFLSIKQTGNSKYGTIKIEIMHPDVNDPAEHELELSVSNSEMDKDGDYMPITLQKDQVRKLIDFLTSCEKVL